MKEITFEELIEEGLSTIDDFDDVPVLMLKLMQQVREATIAEVLKLADNNLFSKEPKVKLIGEIESLPTDRIKTEK